MELDDSIQRPIVLAGSLKTRRSRIGSRAKVYHGGAEMTSGGLHKDDLEKNKYGRIVSKRKSQTMKKRI